MVYHYHWLAVVLGRTYMINLQCTYTNKLDCYFQITFSRASWFYSVIAGVLVVVTPLIFQNEGMAEDHGVLETRQFAMVWTTCRK